MSAATTAAGSGPPAPVAPSSSFPPAGLPAASRHPAGASRPAFVALPQSGAGRHHRAGTGRSLLSASPVSSLPVPACPLFGQGHAEEPVPSPHPHPPGGAGLFSQHLVLSPGTCPSRAAATAGRAGVGACQVAGHRGVPHSGAAARRADVIGPSWSLRAGFGGRAWHRGQVCPPAPRSDATQGTRSRCVRLLQRTDARRCRTSAPRLCPTPVPPQ